MAVVPHLFGTTVYREANPFSATYVWAAEQAIPRVYGDVDFEVISPSTKDDLVARGIDQERIRTIFCGVDHARFTLDDPPTRNETPLVVTWSRLRRYKCIDVAIRAFAIIAAQLPAAKMQIMGRGPDEDRLRRLVTKLGLDEKVIFRGFLPWEELVRTLHRSHVFLNPSPKEGWGLTVVEANQCGVPVVASDRPGLKDSVVDGETGYLVPFGDPEAFARVALRLLTEPELWHSVHEAAKQWAGSFSWGRCTRESLAYFQAVAERTADGQAGKVRP